MQIIQHKNFEKMFLRLDKKIQIKVQEAIGTFIDNPFHPSLHNHPLSGILRGLRSINVTGDFRIHFRELSDGTYEIVEVLKVGTHSQLY